MDLEARLGHSLGIMSIFPNPKSIRVILIHIWSISTPSYPFWSHHNVQIDLCMVHLNQPMLIRATQIFVKTFLVSSCASLLIFWACQSSLKSIMHFGQLNHPKVIEGHPYIHSIHLNVIGSSIVATIISKRTGPWFVWVGLMFTHGSPKLHEPLIGFFELPQPHLRHSSTMDHLESRFGHSLNIMPILTNPKLMRFI